METQNINATKDDTGINYLPKTSIDAFFITDIFCDIVTNALSDRRMDKAITHKYNGGIGAAISKYKNSATPDIIIIEIEDELSEIKKSLHELAEYVEANCKVFLFGKKDEIFFYREIISMGISEYTTIPITPLELIKLIGTHVSDDYLTSRSMVTSFIGSVGGAGTSALAQNTTSLLSKSISKESLLIDFDFNFSLLEASLSLSHSNGLYQAISSISRLDRALLERIVQEHKSYNILYNATAACDIITPTENSITSLLDIAKLTYSSIVIDLPHIWDDITLNALKHSDRIVIVSPPTLGGLKNTKKILDTLSNIRKHDKPPIIVLNMTGVSGRVELNKNMFGSSLGLDPLIGLKFDAKLFSSSEADGSLVVEKNKSSFVENGLNILVSEILSKNTEKQKKKSFLSFFRR